MIFGTCTLVISTSLAILWIGSNFKKWNFVYRALFLDTMTKINTKVMDKAGIVAKGVFKIKVIKSIGWDKKEFMKYLTTMEGLSTHPIAKAIMEYKVNGEDFKTQ